MKSETIYSKYFKSPYLEFVRNHFGDCVRTSSIVLLSIALIAIIFAVYMQVGDHQFLNFDDEAYVTNNPHVANGLTGRNIVWAFTSVESFNWHPITWLSHMTDVQLYGMNPRGHHLTNVAIHSVSALFLFLLLVRLTGALWQTIFVAALFALHPLHVESVAWVAERKDVLSALFWFLTLHLYAEYVAKQKPALYILTFFSFVLGLMSKPMLVTLPFVMLLLDFWPLGRYRHEKQDSGQHQLLSRVIPLIKEKTPFFVCSLFSALITIYAQQKGGAISDFTAVPFWLRTENALIAYVKYIGKTFWPHDLAILYPFPTSIPIWQVISSLLILLLISMATIRTWRRHPYFAVGWFWFIITLVPVIGLMQVGSQSMADRYSYIPVIGLFIMVAWGVPDLTKGLHHRQDILALLAGAVIIASTVLTRQQLDYWQDNISLYRHTLKITTDNTIIHNNLGIALQANGDQDAAIQEYREALRISPNNEKAHNNLGNALQAKGSLDEAIQEYLEALRINPNYEDAHFNLGFIFQAKGNLNVAIKEYQKTLRINPTNADARNNLGTAFSIKGDLDTAIKEFREVLRKSPHNTRAHENLELALAQKKMQGKARK